MMLRTLFLFTVLALYLNGVHCTSMSYQEDEDLEYSSSDYQINSSERHVILFPTQSRPPQNRFIQFWKRKQRFKWLLTFLLTITLSFGLLCMAYAVIQLLPSILVPPAGGLFRVTVDLFGSPVNAVGLITALSSATLSLMVLIAKMDLSL